MRAGRLPGGRGQPVIDSDLPRGAGLSSSAALECATALALAGLYGVSAPRAELARLARRAENEMVGVPSGIMDQSASLLGEARHALLLDCRSGESSLVPFDPAGAGLALLVVDTGVRHALTDGRYALRRQECEQAARALGVPSLRDVADAAQVSRIADPVLARRARHVITDDQRVCAAVALLEAGDLAGLGPVLHASHVSLRDDFEISWPQADAAVAAAERAGALGARMVGGGFGGSVIALVPAGSAAVPAALAAGVRPARLAAAPACWPRRPPPEPAASGDVRLAEPVAFTNGALRRVTLLRGPGTVQATHRRIHMAVTDDAAAIADDIARLRRAIHAEPEVGLDLPLTQQKVLAALDGLPLEVSTGTALSSVTAVLRGTANSGGPVVLLRGDMDALPVTERTGLDYASKLDGAMHACGHDLHTAMLAGAARLLSARRGELAGSVVFMFQPGEEGYAGARYMIEEGVLDAAGERPGRRVRAARRLGPAAHRGVQHPPGADDGRRGGAGRHRPRPRRPRLPAAPRRRPDPGRLRDRAGPPVAGDPQVRHLRSRGHHRGQLPRRDHGQRHPGQRALPGDRALVLRPRPASGCATRRCAWSATSPRRTGSAPPPSSPTPTR